MGAMTGALGIKDVTTALTTITDVTIEALLAAVRRDLVAEDHVGFEFAVIGMGRYGGAEIGFGSDADVLFVYRPGAVDPTVADQLAKKIVASLREVAEDNLVPLELDADLRPEGRKGPVARTIDAYRAYYAKWSVSWEAQALLRARAVAGDSSLLDDFMAMIDPIRYPEVVAPTDVREIKRIKARVETERMPKGADPTRHLKLGPGGPARRGRRPTPRRRLAPRDAPPVGEHSAHRHDQRHAAERLSGARRHRAHSGTPGRQRVACRGAVARRRPSRPSRLRRRLLRSLRRRPRSGRCAPILITRR
jgi:hypothetical protein